MKRILVMIVAVALGLSLQSCGRGREERRGVDLETPAAKAGYAFGLELGASMRQQGQELDLDAFAQGVEDGFLGRTPLLAPAELAEVRTAFLGKIEQDRARALRELAERNFAEGKAFLEANAAKEGVQTTQSGLQYMVLEEGEGARPQPTDLVTFHYRGMLLDGTEFDNSYERGQPATVAPTQVIPGLGEGLQLMRVGSKYRLFIPSELAYGGRAAGPQIGPNATLVFEVELLGIGPAERTGEPGPEEGPQTQ